MARPRHLHPLLSALSSYLHRVLAMSAVLLCVMPAGQAMAATTSLSDALWQTTGFCLDTSKKGSDPIEVMTPDARAYQMSIELRALQEMLRAQQQEAAEAQAMSRLDAVDAEASAPCVVDEEAAPALPGERAVCLPPEALTPPGLTREALEIVAVSLLEDIAPLDLPDGPPNSCQASSSSPDRCESSPPFPNKLQLDFTVHGALIQRIATSSPHARTRHTIPLRDAEPRRLVHEQTGHHRDEERPPQA